MTRKPLVFHLLCRPSAQTTCKAYAHLALTTANKTSFKQSIDLKKVYHHLAISCQYLGNHYLQSLKKKKKNEKRCQANFALIQSYSS